MTNATTITELIDSLQVLEVNPNGYQTIRRSALETMRLALSRVSEYIGNEAVTAALDSLQENVELTHGNDCRDTGIESDAFKLMYFRLKVAELELSGGKDGGETHRQATEAVLEFVNREEITQMHSNASPWYE